MMRWVFIITLLIGLNSTTYACSCGWAGGFNQVAYHTGFVAIVKVKKYLDFRKTYDSKTPMSMEVEVIEVLKGKESRKTIKVWGDTGALCRPYVSQFKKRTTWVMALSVGNENWGHPKEIKTDYSISICGEYWLKVENSEVIGIINENFSTRKQSIQKMNIEEFKRSFKNEE